MLALFAAPRYLKSGITTIPELIGLRYDRSTKLWFSIAYILLYIVVQIPVILYSGSLVFENIFNVSGILGVTKFQAVIILCIIISVIGSIYAIFGGLKAVAVSDTVNGIGLLIGGFMIPFFALSVLGKTALLRSRTPSGSYPHSMSGRSCRPVALPTGWSAAANLR